MKLTKNFSRDEFTLSQTATRLGIDNTLPITLYGNLERLAKWLQLFRDRLSEKHGREFSISISSGYRCAELNKRIGGSKTSSHMKALAADILVLGLTTVRVVEEVRSLMMDTAFDQCIEEFGRWVHIGLPEEFDSGRKQFLQARSEMVTPKQTRTVYEPI